jgi:hypothetical protein
MSPEIGCMKLWFFSVMSFKKAAKIVSACGDNVYAESDDNGIKIGAVPVIAPLKTHNCSYCTIIAAVKMKKILKNNVSARYDDNWAMNMGGGVVS